VIKTVLFAAAAAIATIATAAPALADQVSVSYKDLDLTTAQGQSTLARRLDAAARDACGYEGPTTGSRIVPRAAVECYKQAQMRAKESMATLVSDAQRGG